MKKYNCLVTGGAGFIGSHLTNRLIELGHSVVVVDDLSTGKRERVNTKSEFYAEDIRKKTFPIDLKLDYIFHLAALPRVQFSIERPVKTHYSNVDGTLAALEFARFFNAKFIYSSSSSIYGLNDIPYEEKTKPWPLSPYGLQKWIGELYCDMYNMIWGVDYVALRYFNVYGPDMNLEGEYATVIGSFIKKHKEDTPLLITGDGEQRRDFTYISDVVNANILAMERGSGIINIGAGRNHSVNEIADLFGGKKKYIPARKGEPSETLADIDKARDILGWRPEVDFKKGLKLTRKYFENRV